VFGDTYDAPGPMGHGTHVCGSVAGQAVFPASPAQEAQLILYNGMAPSAKIAFFDIAQAGSEDVSLQHSVVCTCVLIAFLFLCY